MMNSIKRILTTTALVIGMTCGLAMNAQAKLPADMEEYQARFEKDAKTPEGAVKLWMDALFLYQNPATRSLGSQMMMSIIDGFPDDFERNSAHRMFVERLKTEQQIFRSYCAGSAPENNYKADPDNCDLMITKSLESPYEEGVWTIYIQSSGSDSARQVKLIKRGDHWKVTNYANFYQKIRPAK
ncbi:MAG: hypothetical protein IIY06_04745 [Proteobacteria bacterium]|jgi:hypothetical protein|nr:hypothetical protein [Pseudomonadota bacterium]